jgi:thioredoxin-like negative regulator of GroEL
MFDWIDVAVAGIAGVLMLAIPRKCFKPTGNPLDDEKKANLVRVIGLLLLFVGAVFAALHLSKAPSGPIKIASTNISPAPAVNFGPPVTEAECLEFGKKLEAAIAAKDKDAALRLMRIEDLMQRSLSDLDIPPGPRNAMMQGFRKAGTGQVTDILIDAMDKGGHYRFLRVQTVDGRLRALMRLFHPEQGVNYHGITLARFPDGQIASEDMHIMVSGEMLSQTFRRLILPFVAEQNRGLLERLGGAERLYTKHMGDIQALTAAARAGKAKEAMTIYSRLPPELLKDKSLHLIALNATRQGDEADYTALLESYRRNHPNDPSIDIMSIDYFIMKKQYDEALQCLRRADRAIGGDPYLLMMQGTVLADAGKLGEAKAALEEAIAQEPTLENAYWSRVTVALKAKDHADAMAWLKKVVEKCNVTLDEEAMKKIDEYAEFVKSPQFKEVLDWQKARNP